MSRLHLDMKRKRKKSSTCLVAWSILTSRISCGILLVRRAAESEVFKSDKKIDFYLKAMKCIGIRGELKALA